MDTPAQPLPEIAVPTVGSGARISLARPPGSGDALLVAQLAQRARSRAQLVVVACADALDAQRLPEEVAYFDPSLAVRHFPDWETLPYDILSPHQDLVSERLAALHQLLARDAPGALDVLVVPATTAGSREATRNRDQRLPLDSSKASPPVPGGPRHLRAQTARAPTSGIGRERTPAAGS